MQIKRRIAFGVLLSAGLLIHDFRSSEAMAAFNSVRLFTYTLLTSFCVNFWASAQLCTSNCTSINGTPFPSLIDVTTEDLITGLETGLFTSVDLVNVNGPRNNTGVVSNH